LSLGLFPLRRKKKGGGREEGGEDIPHSTINATWSRSAFTYLSIERGRERKGEKVLERIFRRGRSWMLSDLAARGRKKEEKRRKKGKKKKKVEEIQKITVGGIPDYSLYAGKKKRGKGKREKGEIGSEYLRPV